MDLWKYFAVGHEQHIFCNPLSEAKVDELVALLALPNEARVLDIACGKAEFLVRTARRWKCSAVGVDISPYFVADARAKVKAAGLESAIEIVESNGSEYGGKPSSFDAAACLGASWIWGGLEGTLRALSSWAKPGGLVVVGEPFWRTTPSPDHLEAAELTESSFGTHLGNVQTGLGLGLRLLQSRQGSGWGCVFSIPSSQARMTGIGMRATSGTPPRGTQGVILTIQTSPS
jgi:SAM-dependent methyltransferase